MQKRLTLRRKRKTDEQVCYQGSRNDVTMQWHWECVRSLCRNEAFLAVASIQIFALRVHFDERTPPSEQVDEQTDEDALKYSNQGIHVHVHVSSLWKVQAFH